MKSEGIALAAAVMFALSACGGQTPAPAPSEDAKTATPTKTATSVSRPTKSPAGSTSFDASTPTSAPSGSPSSDRVEDRGRIGSMAKPFLSSATPGMVVEIDRVRGKSIPASALTHLRQVLEREAVKPAGITFMEDDQLAPEGGMEGGGGNASYTVKEIRAIQSAFRNRTSDSRTAVVHVLILDGKNQEASGALGIATDASSIVLFAEQIERAASVLVSASAIWRAVAVHEFGHLFGLIELVARSGTSRHEDPDHPGHSPNEGSVMYWAIESSDIATLLEGGPPDDFDADDRADLAALRRG